MIPRSTNSGVLCFLESGLLYIYYIPVWPQRRRRMPAAASRRAETDHDSTEAFQSSLLVIWDQAMFFPALLKTVYLCSCIWSAAGLEPVYWRMPRFFASADGCDV